MPPAVLAKLLNGAALVAYDRGEYTQAAALAEQALGLCEREGDAWGAAFAQSSLGFIAYFQGAYDRAETLLRRGLALARASGDRVNLARTLNNLGVLALARGEPDAVRALFEESLEHWRQIGSDGPTALALLFLGRAAHERGEQARAAALLDESVAVARRAGYARAAGPALYLSGRVAMAQRQHGRAVAFFRESLTIRREQGHRRGIAECFDGLATAAAARRQPEVAARLVGAAEGLRAAIGVALTPFAAATRAQLVAGLERRLGASFAGLRAEGAAMPPDEAIRFALGGRPEAAARRTGGGRRHPSADPDPEPEPSPTLLSQREREAAALLARGLSNREIAAALVVTEGSASNYVKRILAKLGFRSRAQVAVWAARHGFGDEQHGPT